MNAVDNTSYSKFKVRRESIDKRQTIKAPDYRKAYKFRTQKGIFKEKRYYQKDTLGS